MRLGYFRDSERHVLAHVRKTLLLEGRSPSGLVLSPDDLKRFGLEHFAGMIFGMRCECRPRRYMLDNGIVVEVDPASVNTRGGGFRAWNGSTPVIHYGNILALREHIGSLNDLRGICDLLARPTFEDLEP